MNNYHALNPQGHNDNPGELFNNPRQQMNHRPKSTRDDNHRQRLPRDANPVITKINNLCPPPPHGQHFCFSHYYHYPITPPPALHTP